MARNPWKKLLSNVRLVATRHGGYGHEWSDDVRKCEPRPVTITWQDLKEQFIKQDGRCYWYGVELDPHTVFTTGDPSTLSVDRLDNSRGYEPDNIVITCRAANLGRGNTDVSTFIKFVESLKLPNNTKPVYQFFTFDNEKDNTTEAS